MIGARWLVTRKGLGATNHFETCGFIRSSAGVRWPDIQYHFLPAAISYDGSAQATQHGFQAHVGSMRSLSRGHVRLRSAEPREAPKIRTVDFVVMPYSDQRAHAGDALGTRLSVPLRYWRD